MSLDNAERPIWLRPKAALSYMNNNKHRRSVLESFHASAGVVEELLAYNTDTFDHAHSQTVRTFPMDDEPFVAVWQSYAKEARERGVFEVLKDKLVQFAFPIREGISRSDAYLRVTRKGEPVAFSPDTGTSLKAPEKLELTLYETPAGRMPVLFTGERDDFVRLVQVLFYRNEPKPIPDSMGALHVAGYNNWDRIRAYKAVWMAQNPGRNSESDWILEYPMLISREKLYKDRFILLSSGFYSAVEPASLGMDASTWRDLSRDIRKEHECTHYFTKRVLLNMRNNILDELIADCMGIVEASGTVHADWLLHFLGLEKFPAYRDGGRLQNYKGKPPLSDEAFKVLQALVHQAVLNLEAVNPFLSGKQSIEQKAKMILTLASFTLEELAGPDGKAKLAVALSG